MWSRIAPHAVLLSLLLVAVLAVSERSTGFTTDEGSYAIQAEALRGGSWDIRWAFRGVDPTGEHFPYHAGVVADDGELAYVAHPAWPLVLAATSWVLPEEIGLRVVSLAAVLVTAVAAFALARRLGADRAAPWAFWIAAASPVLANGLMLWAHAPATALAALATLAAARAVERPTSAAAAALAATLAGGVLLRSEFVLFTAALVVPVAVVAIARREPRLLGVAGVGAAAGAAALLGERRWQSAIVGEGGSVQSLGSRAGGSGSWLQGRFDAAVTSLLEGAESAPLGSILSLLAVLAVSLAVAAHLRQRPPQETAVLLWAAAGLTLARLVVASDDPVRGLVTAWPVALLAVVAARVGGAPRWLLAAVALYAVAVLASQYDNGGGLQWGGRFFALAIGPLAALAAVGMAALHRRDRSVLRPGAALLVAGGLLGLVVTDNVRSANADGVADIAAAGPDAVLVWGTELARLDWRAWPDRCWLATGPDSLDAALRALEEAGVASAVYVLVDPDDLDAAGAAPRVVRSNPPIGAFGSGSDRCPPRR